MIAASVGLGKTHAALDEVLRLAERGVRTIIIATPTHDLNKQLLQRARARATQLGISASIEMRLGREAIDPAGDGKAKMCLDLESVREVEDVGLDAQSHVCSRKLDDGKVARCPYFESCAFQRQRTKTANIWFVSHAALGHRRPTGIGSPGLLIIDENPVISLLRGTSGSEVTVKMGDLKTVVRDVNGDISNEQTAFFVANVPQLVSMRMKMDVLRKINGSGPVTRTALVETGVTSNELLFAAGQAKTRLFRPRIVPGMDGDVRRVMLERARGNRALLREAMMYELLRDFLQNEAQGPKSGHVRLTTNTDSEGNAHEVWRLTYLARVAKGWRAPTLVLDATARPEYRFAIRAVFPGLRDDLGGEIVAATPHLRIRVVTGRDMSLGSIKANLEKYAREVSAVTARSSPMARRTVSTSHTITPCEVGTTGGRRGSKSRGGGRWRHPRRSRLWPAPSQAWPSSPSQLGIRRPKGG